MPVEPAAEEAAATASGVPVVSFADAHSRADSVGNVEAAAAGPATAVASADNKKIVDASTEKGHHSAEDAVAFAFELAAESPTLECDPAPAPVPVERVAEGGRMVDARRSRMMLQAHQQAEGLEKRWWMQPCPW